MTKKQPRVWIGEGHGTRPDGRFDPGTTVRDTNGNQVSEQDLVGVAVVAAAAVLEERGALVVAEHGEGDPNWQGSVVAVNRLAADKPAGLACAVEFHFDWLKNDHPGGFGLYTSGAGRRLADSIAAAIRLAGHPYNDGFHSERNDLGFLNQTTVPAVIWEISPIDRVPADLAAVGAAIGHGIADFVDLPAIARPVEDDPEPPAPRLDVDGVEIPDVYAASVHAPSIAAAIRSKAMPGYTDGTWRPDEPITRAQLAAVLDRVKLT